MRAIACILVVLVALVGGLLSPALGAETGPIVIILVDRSSSMSDNNRWSTALALLDASVPDWPPDAAVVAVPFDNELPCLVSGPPALVQRLAASGQFSSVAVLPDSGALLARLRTFAPRGNTRLWDAVFVAAGLLQDRSGSVRVEVVSDGMDCGSTRTEQEAVGALARVLQELARGGTVGDVWIRRWGSQTSGLHERLREVARDSNGRITVHDDAQAMPPPALIVKPREVLLVPTEDGAFCTPDLAVALVGSGGPLPLTAAVEEAQGLGSATPSVAMLPPGDSVLALSVQPEAAEDLWHDQVVSGRVRLTAGAATAVVEVSGTVPAGWRRYQGLLVGAVVAIIAGLGAWQARRTLGREETTDGAHEDPHLEEEIPVARPLEDVRIAEEVP